MQTVATSKPDTSEHATRFGGQSMVAKLRSVIVRRPAPPSAPDNWTDFGYLHPVNHADAEREHAALRQILSSEVETVIEAGPDDPGALDAIFSFDSSIVTDAGVVLLRPGKPLRLAEVGYAAATYAELGICRRTLARWKLRPDFAFAERAMSEYLGEQAMRDVVRRVRKRYGAAG